jgi:hypothetical protein
MIRAYKYMWYGLETIFKNNAGAGSSGEPVELSSIEEALKQETYAQ